MVVKNELRKLLDYTYPKLITTRLGSICNTTCTIVAGADQGQGAWRSWIKIHTMSGPEIRKRMAADEEFNPKTSYILSQPIYHTRRTIMKFYLQQYLKASQKDMKSFNLLLSFLFSNLTKSLKLMQSMCQSMLLILTWSRMQMKTQSVT